MADATAELRGDTDAADVGVSVDGTWQRKGFTSTNGVTTAISVDSGKVLDICILSKSCKSCTRMSSIMKSDPAHYEKWKASHTCNRNYSGSSPNMEKIGAIKIFERSLERHKLYYTSFLWRWRQQSISSHTEYIRTSETNKEIRMHRTLPKAHWKSPSKIEKDQKAWWKGTVDRCKN